MVLNHYDANISEQMPVFSYRTHPVVPQIFLGRSASHYPCCKPKDCVYSFFRDAAHSAVPWPPHTTVLIYDSVKTNYTQKWFNSCSGWSESCTPQAETKAAQGRI